MPTAPSTLRVYLFRHDRMGIPKVPTPGYGCKSAPLQGCFAGTGCISKHGVWVQGEPESVRFGLHCFCGPPVPGSATLSVETPAPAAVEWLASPAPVPYEAAVEAMEARVVAI